MKKENRIVHKGQYLLPLLLLTVGCFSDLPAAFEAAMTRNTEVEENGDASGTVELNFDDGEIHVNVSGLPALAADQEYEVQVVMMDGDEMHIGELEIDAEGMGEIEAMFDENMHEISEVRVIREDEEAETEIVMLSAVFQTAEEGAEMEEGGGGDVH